MKIWRWQCSRYLHNHGFILCEKFQCLKFRCTEVIHKKLFLSLLEMHNCVWYLWTCPLIKFVELIYRDVFFWRELTIDCLCFSFLCYFFENCLFSEWWNKHYRNFQNFFCYPTMVGRFYLTSFLCILHSGEGISVSFLKKR